MAASAALASPSTAGELCLEFGQLLSVFLSTMSDVFPECMTTRRLARSVTALVEAGNEPSLEKHMEEWHTHVVSPHGKAIQACDPAFLDSVSAGILAEMHMRDKWADEGFSGEADSRAAFWKYMHDLSLHATCFKEIGAEDMQKLTNIGEQLMQNMSMSDDGMVSFNLNDIMEELTAVTANPAMTSAFSSLASSSLGSLGGDAGKASPADPRQGVHGLLASLAQSQLKPIASDAAAGAV